MNLICSAEEILNFYILNIAFKIKKLMPFTNHIENKKLFIKNKRYSSLSLAIYALLFFFLTSLPFWKLKILNGKILNLIFKISSAE